MEEQIIYHPDFLVIPEGGEKPYLVGYKCNACGNIYIPKLSICPNCWSEELTKIPLSRKGKLYSYSIQYTAQPGIKTPVAHGFVDFPEDVRVLAQIDAELEQIKIGMEMEVTTGVIREERDGKKWISYKFKPVN